MKRKRAALAVVGVVAAAALLSSGPSAASNPGANGHGNLVSGGELRTFSFAVTIASDGTVDGHVTVKNRALDVRALIDIDCIAFTSDSRAILSGPITQSSNPTLIVPGRIAVFGVEDNGEGADAPVDRITTAPDYAAPKSCHEFTFVGDTLREIVNPAVVVRTLTPITAGDILVRT